MNKGKKSRIALVVLVGVAIYFSYTVLEQERIITRKKAELADAKIKHQQQVALKEKLEEEKKSINTDAYIEKVAREKLGMVKPGEKVFVDINK